MNRRKMGYDVSEDQIFFSEDGMLEMGFNY